jgi:hypothetical protein
MSTLERPLKEGSVRTYQEKVGLGFLDILANEMDADLDTIYAAWNGGIDTLHLSDGAVTSAKLAAGAVGTRELADQGVTSVKIADGTIGTIDLANSIVTEPKLTTGAVSTRALGDGQVTVVKLAVGSSLAAIAGTSRTTDTVINSAGTTVLMRVDLTSYRGGPLFLQAMLCGYVTLTDSALTELKLDLYRPTGFLARRSYVAQGSAGLQLPFGVSFLNYLNVGAGADWLELRATRTLGAASWVCREGDMLMTGLS